MALYVDDILLANKSQQKIAQVKADLGEHFLVKDVGELHYFLGVSVKQSSESSKIWIGQPSYTQAVLQKLGFENCKPAVTPVVQGTKLMKATEDSELFDATLFKSAVGMLLYLSGWTRPDVTFAVSSVARYCSKPTKEHWMAIKTYPKIPKKDSQLWITVFKER